MNYHEVIMSALFYCPAPKSLVWRIISASLLLILIFVSACVPENSQNSITDNTVPELPKSTATTINTLLLHQGGVIFASFRDGNSEIYTINADGSDPLRLTNNLSYDGSPVISPDGNNIAFISDRDGNSEIYVMDVAGKQLTNLTNHPAEDIFPDWSPDGVKIAFESIRDGNQEIYVMKADGSNLRRLTNNNHEDYGPRWSPDGLQIVFYAVRDGNFEVHKMDANGSNEVNLTKHPSSDGSPSWSPDGKKIAFDSNRDGHWEVYTMNADGSDQKRLTYGIGNNGTPDWSSDGLRILFYHEEMGAAENEVNGDIYVVDIDGNKMVPVLAGLSDDYDPQWLPGKSVLTFAQVQTSAPTLAVSVETAVFATDEPIQESVPDVLAPQVSSTVPQIRILGVTNPLTSKLELYLEFGFDQGSSLSGTEIERYLNEGVLEITTPDGKNKTFKKIPSSPTDSEISNNIWLPEGIAVNMSPAPAGSLPLHGIIFENYNELPGGPQIRLPLQENDVVSGTGVYQISWQSGNLRSNILKFEWNGAGLIIQEP
jgi:TolB protein